MKKFIKNNISTITLMLLTIFYFEYSVTIAYDSAHYMSYVNIFEGHALWNSWDVVRGPVFPFIIYLGNFLFGKSSQGLIMNTYMYYLIMLIFTYKILKYFFSKLKTNRSVENKWIGIIMFLIIINPFIYGFYHCLLTEFVAITITSISCYLSILWINVDITEERKKYVIYSSIFIILTIFSWFLKQPYVSCTFFVFIISYIIHILENRNLKNFFIRTCTILFCIVMLILSIQGWNHFLKMMGNNPNTDRNPTNSLGNQLINAVDFIKIQNNRELIENNEYIESIALTNEEEKDIKELIQVNKEYLVVNYFDNANVIESDYLLCNNGNVSAATAIKYLMKVFIHNPLKLLNTYLSNYLSIIDIYSTTTTDGVGYVSDKKIDLNFSSEISSLGYNLYIYGNTNILDMSKSMYKKVKCYEQFHYTFKGLNVIMRILGKLYLILFKLLFALLPFLLIIAIIMRIREKRNMNQKKVLDLIIILFGFSLMHVLLHVVTGAIIDRYAIPVFIPVFIGTFILFFSFLKKKRI